MTRLEIKLLNFGNALERLKEAVVEYRDNSKPSLNGLLRDGIIQRFEFTYELAWKAAKAYLEEMGITDKTSPRSVIREAYAQLLITDEANWLLMLNDRNLTSHVYSEEIAVEISERIMNIYLDEFERLWLELST